MNPLFQKVLEARREVLRRETALFQSLGTAEICAEAEAVLAGATELADEDRAFTLQALADVLGRTGSERVIAPLLRILDAPEAAVRLRARDAIVRCGRARPTALFREVEARLAEATPGARAELPGILRDVMDPDGAPPTGILLRLLGDPHPEVAAEAVYGLSDVEDPDASRALVAMLADERPLPASHRGPKTVGEAVAHVLLAADVLRMAADAEGLGEA